MEVDFKHSLLRDKEENILIPVKPTSSRYTDQSLDNVTSEEVHMQIAFLRRRLSSLSFISTPGSQSTFVTALIICNNTLGTAVMILPIVFGTCGIINSLIVMSLIGVVQFITCKLILIHLKESEPDLPQLTERILGKTWKAVFVISSCVFEFSTGVVYLILMNNMLYPILVFFFELAGFENYAKKSENRYDIFSFQITAWIFMVPCFLSCFMKNMDAISVLSKIGIYVLCSYVIFLFYVLFDNISAGTLQNNIENISYITTNVTDVSGAFCLAFFIHSAVCPLVKNIEKKEETTKSLGISYIMSGVFYFLIGLVGYLGILGRETVDDPPQTIMDFFSSQSIFPFIIEVLYFLKLITVYPLFCYISRTQLFSLFFARKTRHIRASDDFSKPPEEPSHFIPCLIYNTLYIGVSQACVLFNVNLTFVMGLTGAVFGFLLVFVIPVAIHLKCYGFDPIWPTRKTTPKAEDRIEMIEKIKCNEHPDRYFHSNWLRALFYIGLLLPFGIYLFTIQLIALFDFDWF